MTVTTRVYHGTAAETTTAFNRDKAPMEQAGWFATAGTYQPGQWSGGQFLVALLLCIVLIGFLVFVYMVIVKPPGSLVVTYEWRGAGVAPITAPFDPYGKAPPGYICGKCQRPLSPAWAGKCHHCGTRFLDVTPLPRLT